MTHIDDRPTDRYLTACHEAGHAVAGHMRGGEVDSISIKPTAKHEGIIHWHVEPRDPAFAIYAGPWAEARAQWGGSVLDGVDDDGCTFDDYLTRAWSENTHDWFRYQWLTDSSLKPVSDAVWRQFRPNDFGGDLPPAVPCEETWDRELEHAWPVIQQVAERRLSGPVTGHTIRALLDAD